MRRFVIVSMVVMLTVIPVFSVNGVSSYTYEKQADVLHDLGLYQGVSTTEFDPDLGAPLDRETGAVMLLRIFGLEEDAQAVTDADAVLARFTDSSSISDWAKKSVAYAVKNGLVLGNPDGTFGPKQPLNGKAYCTLILRQMGYTPDYSTAPLQLAGHGGLTAEEANKFLNKDLIKDDLVGISYGTLKAKYECGTTVIHRLVESGVVDSGKAMEAGLM